VYNATADAWFSAAAVAQRPAVGVTKPEVLLVTLTFHIVNDVCWPQGSVSGVFELKDIKASDSCTEQIHLCDTLNGYWNFIAVEPEVYIEPKEQINCVVGEKVTYSVWVHNITKMKSLHFDLRWKGNHIVNPYEDPWLPILNITKKDVVINEAVFPKANRTKGDIFVYNWSNQTFSVVVDIVMDCNYQLINGTFKAVDLTFTKMDPWYCGRQPNYTRTDHVWTPDNATTPLWFDNGYIDVCCPDPANIYFGKNSVVTEYWYVKGDGVRGDRNDMDLDVWKYTYYDKVTFVLGIRDVPGVTVSVYGASFVFSTTPTNHATKTFQVWLESDSTKPEYGSWVYQTYGTGWDGLKTTTMPVGIAVSGSLTDRWFTVTIPCSYLGGVGHTFYWGIQGRFIDTPGFKTWINTAPISGVGHWYVNPTEWGGKEKCCLFAASYNEAVFIFMPVSGDLTGDGKVELEDLRIIAGKYGKTWTWPFPGTWEEFRAIYYYDFDKDKDIDIFDIIVVSKNFGAECPF
jgi:hypothetical protein